MAYFTGGESCCGFREIAELSQHGTGRKFKAKKAMQALFQVFMQKRKYVPQVGTMEYVGYGRGDRGGAYLTSPDFVAAHFEELEKPEWTEDQPSFCHAVFTGVKRDRYAQKFAAFIKAHKFGKVVSVSGWNPNMRGSRWKEVKDGQLLAFLWTFNIKNIQKWVEANYDPKVESYDDDY